MINDNGYENWLSEKEYLERQISRLDQQEEARISTFRRARWLEQGERPSRYFFRTARARPAFTYIDELQRRDGSMATTVGDTIGMARSDSRASSCCSSGVNALTWRTGGRSR